mmetsp:Transcript_26591/g.103503  ORF Transcript_26591/g.103503 Transcript_26591/m.103503 type:complete len:456 (-) Transcript_26591:824-2191(-)|eukprot:CAMPEP_0113966934 /NCGR_PEP_ID=MMETSP0011_2-20120614/8589_1 /TAXON_ID=101924 /ORGANISM="Rhodosorus marinus" /LENGTH=455 /DNA_ID=CAMNT_0000979639 /DNA_START=82 /DNA_END=1449 /DNA_ORIENTATION=+ /assembly_acc=CAM_ASM_000156
MTGKVLRRSGVGLEGCQKDSIRGKRAASQKGFALALAWLKNLDEDEECIAEVVKPSRVKREKAKKGERESRKRRPKSKDYPVLAGEQNERSTPLRKKYSCSNCGRVYTSVPVLRKHVVNCKARRRWSGLEKVLCSVCGVDHDDGQQMVECESCHVWEHVLCNNVTNLALQWYCEHCVQQEAVLREMEECLAVCETCLKGDDPGKLFLCDSCNRGFHTYCMLESMKPPLPSDDQWHCSESCRSNIDRFDVHFRERLCDESKRLPTLFPDFNDEAYGLELIGDNTLGELRETALKMLNTCFAAVDGRNGMDVEYINASLRSAKYLHWDNSMHRTLVLRLDNEILCLCTFRLLGDNTAAELIFAATHEARRKTGLFRYLHDVLVRALASYGVKNFVIHATSSTRKHFMRYSGEVLAWSGHVRLDYVPTDKNIPEHRRLLPRLLEMGSQMIVSPITRHS